MSSFAAVRLVAVKALDALGRLVVAGAVNLPAAPFRGMLWGSATAHLVYLPLPGDQLLLARTASGTDQPVAPLPDPAATIAVLGFGNGDIGFRTSAGALVRLSGASIYLTPGSGGKIVLNGGTSPAIGANAAIAIGGTITAPSGGGACTFSLSGTVSSAGNSGVQV